jgi:hypothetical protein
MKLIAISRADFERGLPFSGDIEINFPYNAALQICQYVPVDEPNGLIFAFIPDDCILFGIFPSIAGVKEYGVYQLIIDGRPSSLMYNAEILPQMFLNVRLRKGANIMLLRVN